MFRFLLTFAVFNLLLPISSSAATTLTSQLSGRIVLAFEERGEAWYIDPVLLKRPFLGRPDDALQIMRSYGLGITRTDLEKIPEIDSSMTGDLALRRRLSGRILLQVQEHGEAWYVEPVSLRRVYLGRPTDAFRVMSSYGLGISSSNLNRIAMAEAVSGSDADGSIANEVPFTTQAPLGQWSDPRQQDGCEEAAALMAVAWARGESLSAAEAEAQIMAMSDWEEDQFGYYQDTGLADTADRLINDYLEFTNYDVNTSADTTELIAALEAGHIVILPINGQVFSPFHYTPPGPARLMIVVHGYNPATGTFSVHDPGTSQGASLQVTTATLELSWRDYASGEQVTIPVLPKSMLVIKK
jgi:hypothetical protein